MLTITGYSTALFATWYFIEELGILFDAGDGVIAGLTQKSGKIRHVFLSHADRDHVTGLLQLNQLKAKPGFPKMYYPADSQSFPALQAFSLRFDPHVARTDWQAIGPESRIAIGKDWEVQPVVNGHISTAGGRIKSLSYIVHSVRHKLREAYVGKSGPELAQLRKDLGDDAVVETVRTPYLAYSGDTPVEDATRYKNVRILIHEATFMDKHSITGFVERPNKHSTLPEVIEMAAGLELEALILGHFSCRYETKEIDAAIQSLCRTHRVAFPVYRVAPATMHTDILTGEPCWAGLSVL